MKTSLLLAFLCWVTMGFAEVGLPDLEAARKLADEGKFEEALQKHIWFHEESKKSPGMGGVRLSYALSDWVKLSEKYPRAKVALIEIRDKNKKVLLDGTGDFQDFHDFTSINRELKEDEKTYELFKEIDQKHLRVAANCYIVAKEILLQHGEYEICGKYTPDPLQAYEDIRHMRETNMSLTRTNPQLNTPEMIKWADNSFIKDTRHLVEILVGTGKKSVAEEIQSKALSYFNNDMIKSAVFDAEKRIKNKSAKPGSAPDSHPL